jgi:hypothetical protein
MTTSVLAPIRNVWRSTASRKVTLTLTLTLTFSWGSCWLQAGRPSFRSSSPGRDKIYLFSTSSRRVLGLTQPPFQWVPEVFPPASKAARAWSLQLVSHLVSGQGWWKWNVSSPHLRTETDPVSETLCFLVSIEYRTMDKVQNPSNSEFYRPS